jgi:tripartite ATP-independent transporter DctP family solute receptor
MTTVSRRTLIASGATSAAVTLFNILPARGANPEFSYKYGNQVPATHPVSVAFQKAAARILTESNGRLEIGVFPNSQLGGDTDMLSQTRSGALEFFTISGLVLSTLVSVAAINGLGFAFKTYEDAWRAMDGDLGLHVRDQIRKANLLAMEKIWDGGYRQITSSTKPIVTADDLKGFKIRVPVSPLWTSMFKAFGASPAGINFSEVYSALQTKIVDGQETPLVSIQTAKLYEVQKYCSMTNHMWDGYWLVANVRAWERLPPDLQELAARHFNEAALEQRLENRRLNETLEGALKAAGLTFNTPDTDSFRTALVKAGFYTDWMKKFGPEAWQLLEKYTGALA